MIVWDSSVWIEWWSGGDVRRRVISAETGKDGGEIVVPATVAFETYRWLVRSTDDENEIDDLASSLEHHELVDIDLEIARRAAVTSITTGLGAADATILTVARLRRTRVLTYDSDFAGIPDVTVLTR